MKKPNQTTSSHQKTGVRGSYTWNDVHRIISELYAAKKSYRRIAREDFFSMITHATIQRILAGKEPVSPKIRAILNLPEYKTVTPVNGEIPVGSQAISATQCSCGTWFISNHPRRTRCFICSPYKGKPR